MSEEKKMMTDAGCLWVRLSKTGVKYITGLIELDGKKVSIVGFTNKNKDGNEKRPDWKLYLDDKQPQQKTASKPTPKPTPKPEPVVEENIEI